MDDQALRAKLIRLATEHPELRTPLLPLLRDRAVTAVAMNPQYWDKAAKHARTIENLSTLLNQAIRQRNTAPMGIPAYFRVLLSSLAEISDVLDLGTTLTEALRRAQAAVPRVIED